MECPYERENLALFEGVYKRFSADQHRLLPFAAIHPSEKVDKQVLALEKLAADYKICGLKLHPTIMKTDVRHLLKSGKRLLEFAGAARIPIIVHSAVIETDKWARPEYILEVAQKNPQVRFSIGHMARFDRVALEKAHQLDNTYVDTSGFISHIHLAHQNHPGVKIGEQRFVSNYSNPNQVMNDLVTAFPGTIIFGTDNPAYYWIEEHAGTLFEERNTLEDEMAPLNNLPDSLRKEISHDNARKFLFNEV